MKNNVYLCWLIFLFNCHLEFLLSSVRTTPFKIQNNMKIWKILVSLIFVYRMLCSNSLNQCFPVNQEHACNFFWQSLFFILFIHLLYTYHCLTHSISSCSEQRPYGWQEITLKIAASCTSWVGTEPSRQDLWSYK